MADDVTGPVSERPDPYAQSAASGPTMSARTFSTIDARVNPNAMIGLITGIVSIFFNLLFLLAPLSIVFSILGIVKGRALKAQGVTRNLLTHAYIGLGCGILSVVIGIIQLGLAISVNFSAN